MDSFSSYFSLFLHFPACRTYYSSLPRLQLGSHWADAVLLITTELQKPCATPAIDGILHLNPGSHSTEHLKSLSWSQTASGLPSSCSAVGKSLCSRSWKQSRNFPGEPDKPGLAIGISVNHQHLRQRWIYVEGKGFSSLSCGQLDLMRQLLLWRVHSQSSSPAGMS